MQGVARRANERLHAQILLQRLEEEFNVPPVFVDARDRRRAPGDVVRQEDEGLVPIGHLHTDAAQRELGRIFMTNLRAVERNLLVGQHAPARRDGARRGDVEVGVRAAACDKDHAGALQVREPRVIDVAHVEHQHCARLERLLPRDGHVMALAFRDHQHRGEIPIVVQGEMQLHRALPAPEGSPRKQVGTQVNDRRIQTQQLIRETKLLRPRDRATARQQLIEDRLIQLPGTVRIGIRERRPLRGGDPELRQPAFTARQPAADLAQRVRAPQLAEQHRDKLAPAREPPRVPLGLRLHHEVLKVRPRKELEQLIEDAAESGHRDWPPVCGDGVWRLRHHHTWQVQSLFACSARS